MTTLTVEQKLAAARIKLRDRFPYFRAALFGAVYRAMPGLGTYAMTATGILLYDPETVEKESLDDCVASIMHELMHWLRDHAGRCKTHSAEPRLWNIAADAEINDDVRDMGLTLPNGCIFAAMLQDKDGKPMEDGSIAEVYYGALRQAKKDPGEGQSGEGEPKDGEPKDGPGSPGLGSGKCGSVAGHAHEKEPATGTGTKPGEDGGRSDQEAVRVRKQVAGAVMKHAAAKGRGSVPGGFLVWAESQIAPPKVDWRTKLGHVIRSTIAYRPGAVTTTWQGFGRKQAALGFGPGKPMTPKWVSPVPRVAVAMDTSGSMCDSETMKLAAAEVAGILKTINATVNFIACDAKIHSAKPVRTWQEAVKEFKGGGGTDFRPVFEHLHEKRRQMPVDVLVFITDGQGPAPEKPPQGIQTIWVLIGGSVAPAPWGTALVIE